MSEFLKHYKMKIHVLSPVHIGNGDKIGKKEYIYVPWEHKVIVPDIQKMYAAFTKKRLDREYQKYMLGSSRDGLGAWLKQYGYQVKEYTAWEKYAMDAGDAFSSGTSAKNRPREIMCFVKDAYGLPYVPGSSLKGMIRTALLAYELCHHSEKFSDIQSRICQSAARKAKRTVCLRDETSELETTAFHTLDRPKQPRTNAVNCNLSGLIVSDSAPLSLKQLTLSQKVDYTIDGKEKPLPILREALMPGTDIFFDITIDSQCPYTIEIIMEALNELQQCVNKYFYSRFRRGSSEENIVWLGGGTGFLSKTVLYPMFGIRAVKVTDDIFKNTLGDKVYQNHKHYKDVSMKLSPHVCKCTRYNGKLYDMGMGKIEIVRE